MPNGEATKHPYNDESGRFELIAEVYLGGYSWGIACVWRDKATGRLYGDEDGGCSCYDPFEPYDHTFENCKEITCERDAAALLDHICGGDEPEPTTTQRRDFVTAVRAALSAQRN